MTQTPPTQITDLDGTFNFRDLGGLPTPGGATNYGVLFRSDALHKVTPAGEAELAASDIGVVVDFRTAFERDTARDKLPRARAITDVHMPLQVGNMMSLVKEGIEAKLLGHTELGRNAAKAMANIPALGDMYVSMLEGDHAASDFATVARFIATPPHADYPGVLVHCTAGKDRTGVCTALMLDAVGVQRDAIVADYAATAQNLGGGWLDGMKKEIGKTGLELTPALLEMIGGSPAAAMEQVLSWLDTKGGAAAYLQSGGLTDAELASLRERFVG